MPIISAAEAIKRATVQMMFEDPSIIVIGEGVPDPKACFGTTKDLKSIYSDKVFDMPISENGGTGICIGASLNGLKPIMVHMRQDFLMYAMDQIVNNAAKWWQMFGGQKSVPIVIRAFTGRGWGQGIQHSQNLEAMFAHVPGLKVVCPSNAYNAKGLLVASVRDPNPVIFLEHRWVHSLTSDVPDELFHVELGKGRFVSEGKDITIVSWGYPVTECIKAAEFLVDGGVSVELIDLQSVRPLDWELLEISYSKTNRMLVVSDAWSNGVAADILSNFNHSWSITNPNYATPPAPTLTRSYYPNVLDIVTSATEMVGWPMSLEKAKEYQKNLVHDVPNPDFKGPF